jgi:RNA polymerase sigma-70 factor (ECF subfamily)
MALTLDSGVDYLHSSYFKREGSATGTVRQLPDNARGQIVEQRNDDQELLRQMIKGNAEAFGALYQRYQRPIFHFAWHMSENSTIAEEITQDVFMHLISNPNRYDPSKGSVGAYLFGIARNLMRREMQENPLHLPITEELVASQESGGAADFDVLAQLSQSELVERLRRAVLALPEQYREVLVLRDLEQMGHRETAELLQCSEGTVASRLHRARAMLKVRLSHGGGAK